MPPTSVHFNGSVNLPDAETVMREISSRIPSGLSRMPDGETGDRIDWVQFQMRKFAEMPEFVEVASHAPGTSKFVETAGAPPTPVRRLAAGVSAESVNWPNLGYADAYFKSYELFYALQQDGRIPSGLRFQMQYPTPLASTAASFVPEEVTAITASYEAALLADLDRALARIPHDHCAVQWDVCMEMLMLEGFAGFDATVREISASLVRCVDRVPADLPVGLHLCYGDYGHMHQIQPKSLECQVQLLSAVAAAASRPVDWASFTVPQDRRDEGYFAPLRELAVGPETELDFGIVPYYPADQAPGTTDDQVRAIDAALAKSRAGARDWGIATECGMGRVANGDVLELLDLHRDILERQREHA